MVEQRSKADADRNTLVMKGLGLVENDKSFFGIYCSKRFVNDESNEGVDLAIYDAKSSRVAIEKVA